MILRNRRDKRGQSTQLNCFSPPVMLATFVIEIVMALYTIWRYKLDIFGRLVVAMLAFLAIFQIAEYFVCGGAGLEAEAWSRIGYVSITMLPPLGLHMLYIVAKKPGRKLVGFAYATAAICIGYFLLYDAAFVGYQCTGNYVIFQLGRPPAIVYGVYYYGWVLAVLALGTRWARAIKSKVHEMIEQKQTIIALMVGYLVFLIPTAIANTVSPETRRGIPSIMCGFAVLYALILVFYILPKVAHKRTK